MIQLGTALKSTEDPYHRWVVISDPLAGHGQIVLLRLTTDDGTWPDRDCLLGPVDWPELSHLSTVAYSTTKWGSAGKALEGAIKSGLFKVISSPSNTVLKKIIRAARTARGMPPLACRFLADENFL